MALQPQKPGSKGPNKAFSDPRALQDAERQERHSSELLAEECGEIEEDLEVLKARYEMFFLGIERREPARERDEMKRRIGRIKGEFTRNTGLQFRIQTLNARYLSYERMWLRSAREKEAGTYRRDLMRARRHVQRGERREAPKSPEAEGSPAPVAAAPVVGPEAEAASPPAESARREEPPPAAAPRAPAVTPPRAPAARTGSAPPLPAGVSEAQLRSLYDAYVEAKRRCNEDVSRCSYESLARSVAKQVPELVAKYKARAVEFKVVIREGRAVLKAVPKV